MMTLKARCRSPWVLFVIVLLLGSMIRLGYGIARYHSSFTRTGTEFITIWDFDALEHVLIAKALMEDGTYTVAAVPGVEEKHVRGLGRGALFKAPLYQMFLATVFAISGFSFALYFPLQALLGGLLSGLAALIALESFQDQRVAYFAGIAAAMHPILVNSASQPYNENLLFALLLGSIWAYSRWLSTHLMSWALTCGALGGLAILCRETALPPFATLVLFALFVSSPDVRRIRVVCVMLAVAALIIVPWSMRNYLREGAVVPVASNTGTALGIGNNECLAQEPILSWYYAEGPCSSLDIVRAQILDRFPPQQRQSAVVQDRIYGTLGIQFITKRPVEYLGLCLRRLWTVLLPFHPRQELGRVQRIALSTYWLIVIPAGLAGAVAGLRSPNKRQMLLMLLICATLLPLILIYFSPDMRYRVGADLLFASFAGWAYLGLRRHMARRTAGERYWKASTI